MSRLAVRQAIATFLNNAEIDYVGAVFPARPIILSEDAYEQRMLNGVVSQITSGIGSGCALVVNITEDHRDRMADTGFSYVNDMNRRSIAVELWFACAGDPENGAGAQGDYDSIVDGIFIAVRSDPMLGTANQPPASIWSAGTYPPYISHEQSAPYTRDDGLTVFIKGVVKFEAMTQDVGAAGTI